VPDAGRVIAGSAKGIRLRAPGPGTRPLADRVKQTLFAILEPDLRASHVLDLFAGSGAAGIEALSRGAAHVTFVEKDAAAVGVIEANLRATRLSGPAASVVRSDALSWLGRPPAGAGFDIAIVDPPYAETGLLARVLEVLGDSEQLLRPGCWVVAKHFWRDRPSEQVGMLTIERERRLGETALTFYRREEAGEAR
jgi:16S rRNA (guanine966-N2)-methyltransferase